MKILVTAPYNENGLISLREQFGEVIYRPWKPNGRAYYADELLQLLDERIRRSKGTCCLHI